MKYTSRLSQSHVTIKQSHVTFRAFTRHALIVQRQSITSTNHKMNHPNNRVRRNQAMSHRHRGDRLPHIHRKYPKPGIHAGSTLDDMVLSGSLPLTWHEVVPDLSPTNTEQARNGNYTVHLDRNDDQLLLFAKMFFEPHNSPMEQLNAQNTALKDKPLRPLPLIFDNINI